MLPPEAIQGEIQTKILKNDNSYAILYATKQNINQIKSNIYFFLQVYFGPINSTLYLHVKKLARSCNTCNLVFEILRL